MVRLLGWSGLRYKEENRAGRADRAPGQGLAGEGNAWPQNLTGRSRWWSEGDKLAYSAR
jgi:hypothetical protein